MLFVVRRRTRAVARALTGTKLFWPRPLKCRPVAELATESDAIRMAMLALPTDVLARVAAHVDSGDLPILAMAHPSLRSVVLDSCGRTKITVHALGTVGRLRWVRSLAPEAQPRWVRRWDARTMDRLAAIGAVECMAFARAGGVQWDTWTCARAAEHGQLRALQYLRDAGCPWDDRTCAMAAQGGHGAVLWWARDAGCPWDAYTCEQATRGRHLALLRELHERGCPWDHETYQLARSDYKRRGDALSNEILQWVQDNDCPELPPYVEYGYNPDAWWNDHSLGLYEDRSDSDE